MATPILLYRKGVVSDSDDLEIQAAVDAGFEVVPTRVIPWLQVDPHGRNVVVGRYSVLPYYQELESDLKSQGFDLINSYRQHRFVADIRNYCDVLGSDLTPETWDVRHLSPPEDSGPWILKGTTSSRKDVPWRKGMFAPNKEKFKEVLNFLENDTLIAAQGVVARRYVPLKTYLEGVTGQPITNEWRVFVCYGEIVASGYYWSSYEEETREFRPSSLPEEARLCVEEAIRRVGSRCTFYVVDVAEKAFDGGWIVVELNDGQMSGLSEVSPQELYSNLYRVLSSPQGKKDD